MDLALTAALELRADLIFMITDGTPSVRQGRKSEEDKRWRQRVERFEKDWARFESSQKGQKLLAEYEKERSVWRAERDRVIAEREARGLPPVVREGGSRGAPSKPGPSRPSRPTRYYDLDEVIKYVRSRARVLYESAGTDLPTLNVVGYSPNARGSAVIAALAKTFPDGTHREMSTFDASRVE
jgi:hypothetical protein